MTPAVTDSSGSPTSVLGLNKDSVSDRSTVSLTPTGAISGAKLKISNNKGTVLKTLTVDVADGSTTAISVKNSSTGTSSSLNSTGGTVNLTATVTSTKFNPGAVNWTKRGSGGSFDVTTGNRVIFTAPPNNSETNDATYTITAICDGQSANYTVTVAHKTASINYYWYVGQTNPTSMASISPIVKDNTSPGWRSIGTSIPSYSVSNMLWNENKGVIVTGDSLAKQYVAIPAKSSACPRDGAGNDASTVAIYNKLNNITIGGVEYKVYETVGKSKKYLLDTY